MRLIAFGGDERMRGALLAAGCGLVCAANLAMFLLG